jgi:hypothetical protein
VFFRLRFVKRKKKKRVDLGWWKLTSVRFSFWQCEEKKYKYTDTRMRVEVGRACTFPASTASASSFLENTGPLKAQLDADAAGFQDGLMFTSGSSSGVPIFLLFSASNGTVRYSTLRSPSVQIIRS